MEEDSKRPSHISYKEYQKKVTKKPNEGIIIFVSAFFILLLLFLGIAKQLSPEIDVGIGDDENSTSTEEIADADKTSVKRLFFQTRKKMTTLILQLKKRLHFLTKAQIQDL